jgi:two-component system response regulator FixJ
MTGHGDAQTAVRAMKSCTHEVIEKPFDDERLFSAIDQALAPAGQVFRAREAAEARNKTAALSPREREVLDALMAGKPNKVIAYDLGISVRTVEVHRARMLERLGTRSTAEAIRLAVIATLAPHSAAVTEGPFGRHGAGKSRPKPARSTTPGRSSAHSSASRSHFAKTAAAS